MNTFNIGVRCVDPPLVHREYSTRRASSLHYAVREALAAYERKLPRGWKHVEVTVTR